MAFPCPGAHSLLQPGILSLSPAYHTDTRSHRPYPLLTCEPHKTPCPTRVLEYDGQWGKSAFIKCSTENAQSTRNTSSKKQEFGTAFLRTRVCPESPLGQVWMEAVRRSPSFGLRRVHSTSSLFSPYETKGLELSPKLSDPIFPAFPEGS